MIYSSSFCSKPVLLFFSFKIRYSEHFFIFLLKVNGNLNFFEIVFCVPHIEMHAGLHFRIVAELSFVDELSLLKVCLLKNENFCH